MRSLSVLLLHLVSHRVSENRRTDLAREFDITQKIDGLIPRVKINAICGNRRLFSIRPRLFRTETILASSSTRAAVEPTTSSGSCPGETSQLKFLHRRGQECAVINIDVPLNRDAGILPRRFSRTSPCY
ncbi:hypothetical protein PUN28_017755 [Cardiocondyla obscurior]|uniref:Secreted protein n=1 Tax=Cardiocondyla obscurior TaxID=286306 RepID=A0AAW2EJ05_9HYME